jgi:hypothetical protein
MTTLRKALDQRLDALRGKNGDESRPKSYGGTTTSQISRSLEKSGILTKKGKVRILTQSS